VFVHSTLVRLRFCEIRRITGIHTFVCIKCPIWTANWQRWRSKKKRAALILFEQCYYQLPGSQPFFNHESLSLSLEIRESLVRVPAERPWSSVSIPKFGSIQNSKNPNSRGSISGTTNIIKLRETAIFLFPVTLSPELSRGQSDSMHENVCIYISKSLTNQFRVSRSASAKLARLTEYRNRITFKVRSWLGERTRGLRIHIRATGLFIDAISKNYGKPLDVSTTARDYRNERYREILITLSPLSLVVLTPR